MLNLVLQTMMNYPRPHTVYLLEFHSFLILDDTMQKFSENSMNIEAHV